MPTSEPWQPSNNTGHGRVRRAFPVRRLCRPNREVVARAKRAREAEQGCKAEAGQKEGGCHHSTDSKPLLAQLMSRHGGVSLRFG